MLNTFILHNDLLEEWKNARSYPIFCLDGIIDENVWANISPKILFLLKESNDNFYKIANKPSGWGPHGTSNRFWRNINIWSYIITELYNNRRPSLDLIATVKERKVDGIAYVNVKKNAECKPISNNNDIYNYAVSDKEFIKRQIDLINPDIIYCCGNINSMKAIYDTKEISHKLYLANGKFVIDGYHPSCRNGFESNYKRLCDILNTESFLTYCNKIVD